MDYPKLLYFDMGNSHKSRLIFSYSPFNNAETLKSICVMGNFIESQQ